MGLVNEKSLMQRKFVFERFGMNLTISGLTPQKFNMNNDYTPQLYWVYNQPLLFTSFIG